MICSFACLKLFLLSQFQHHCRKCGSVICGNCSKNRALLPNQSKKPLRVCDTCHNSVAGKSQDGNQNTWSGNADSSGEDDSDEDCEENPSWSSAPKFYHGSNQLSYRN